MQRGRAAPQVHVEAIRREQTASRQVVDEFNRRLRGRHDSVSGQKTSRFGSAHEAGFNMAFCDGTVRKMSYSIDPTIHMQLGHRSDGEPTDLSKIE